MMNNKIYFLAIVLLSMLASCSGSKSGDVASETNGEIVLRSDYDAKTDEIIIDDRVFENDTKTNLTSSTSSGGTTQTASDGSQIKIVYDGFGNRTETRTFNNHPLLRFVLLRNSVDGKKQVFVYGQNGEVKNLPENMFDRTSTATASELANSAGISEFYPRQPSYTPDTWQPNVAASQPLPSSRVPIQNQPLETAETEEIEKPTDTVEKAASIDGDKQPTVKKQVDTTDKKPDDQ